MTREAFAEEEKEKAEELAPIQEMVRACIQCGTCTGSCPNAYAMDITPRAMWRRVLAGDLEGVFDSRTFVLCSACYTCTLRCPRGLPLTEAVFALKQMAARRGGDRHRASTLFYKAFMKSVEKHGRVQETEFMLRYFVSMKNPLLPFEFAPLGMKFLSKGILSPGIPIKGNPRLAKLFRKASELEDAK
jgi:heterodisulfide reductase subunit C2